MFRALCLIALAAATLYSQAQSSSADLKGTVSDPSGASIPRAVLTITDPKTGFTRTMNSGQDGDFLFRVLPPSQYNLRVEAPGFAAKTLSNVELRVGETVTIDIPMGLQQTGTEVQVSAELPVIETARYQQSSTVEYRSIANLPINKRNYLDFALLTPGVSNTNNLADGTDYRVAQTPHSGLSFGGGNGRANGFFIDGLENVNNSGGVRYSVSQEAVQEFQINRNSFSAEYGWTSGGTVNIVTRSGTNNVHGNLFGFLRHRAIQARNYFDPGKSSFTRVQAGATFGAPIRRDKTFVFLGFERLDRHETEFVTILQDRSVLTRLTDSQQQLFDYFAQSGNLLLGVVALQGRRLLVPASNPNVSRLFDQNSGTFPLSETSPAVSYKLDHFFSERHNMFFRGNYNTISQRNSQLGALVGFNRGRSFDICDGTIAIADNFVPNERWVVETRAMFNYNRQHVIPNDPNGPEINVEGFGLFGREIFLPSSTYERHYNFLQNISFHSGSHTLKFGYDVNPVRDNVQSQTFFSGRFNFGQAIPLSSLFASALGDPNFPATVTSVLESQGRPDLIRNLNSPITALQAYSLGLPTFYQQGFGDPAWIGWSKRYGMYLQDSWLARRGLTLNFGLRYDVEVNPPVLGTDPNNFAPRFGFAWAPGKGRTVVRGAYGIYYSPTYAQYANVAETLSGTQIRQVLIPLTGFPLVTNPRTGRPVTSSDIYGTLLGSGIIGSRKIDESDLLQFGLRVAPGLPGRVVFGSDPVINPYSQQASLEIERAVADYTFSVAYNFNRGTHIGRTLGRNVFYTGRLADGRPTFGRFDPSILQLNVFAYNANSFYHAGILQVQKRMRRHFGLNAHYTWSKAIDESTDFNSDFSPHDQLNARAERALSAFHQAHRVVANAVIESPLKSGRDRSLYDNVFGNWLVAPIVQYNSFRPFNLLTGVDTLNDGYITNKRPHKAGRNIGQGPDFFSMDLRISRRFPFRQDGSAGLEFIAEGFNMLNRTNFRTVNHTVGDVPLESLPTPVRAFRGSPSQPLAYTSALEPRQFQFGLKISY
jgi:hypothetical protein